MNSKMRKIKTIIKNGIISLMLFMVVYQNLVVTALADNKDRKDATPKAGGGGSLANDKVVTGATKLIADATGVMLTIGIPVCGLLAVYFFIRKANADEQDQKIWKNRIVYTIIAAIGMTVVGGLLTTILSYFK